MTGLPFARSLTIGQTLEGVLAKLRSHPSVHAVLLMGSAANDTLHSHSDYDLAVVVDNAPPGLVAIDTFIDHRFAEIFCFSVAEVETLAAKESIQALSREDWLLNWVKTGRVVWDSSGLLERIKQRSEERLATVVAFETVYGTWHQLSYNLCTSLRYASSRDDLYLEALDVRLLHAVSEAFAGYFNVRRIPWRGEKAAIEWLREHDPEFLAIFRGFHQANNRDQRVRVYNDMVIRALEPVGGPWRDGTTTPGLRSGFDERAVHDCLEFWSEWMREPQDVPWGGRPPASRPDG